MNDSLNNKELVAAGHEFAKALSSDTAIIDIAKMVSRLAEQLDCTTAVLREMTKQRDTLAAENAGLKGAAIEAKEEMEEHHDNDLLYSYDADGEQMDALLRLCDAQGTVDEIVLSIKTPVTDAWLAEVRAQGLEMLSAEAERLMDEFGDDSYKVMVTADLKRFANAFAAQLRQGGAA